MYNHLKIFPSKLNKYLIVAHYRNTMNLSLASLLAGAEDSAR